ncbi:16S rRNA (adenine(1518)-N(6)/adenine(1519)-N(6))-dimethyltransferase RsmA [Candidatus Methanocrinis natronophilus]|uniref:Probable ribosomal RNA small subunit methyltransferase A n=1 Tax=Candidatus Methanocrinis natronophilus TaxID=3033396 RepID=A0ABT5X4U3_9EURY|nr:16S rRNA (adenine(1518)-N(6)/adenine(1519)-N(6))-dimethyltransferase RsmA [Candidatus Methanocrinis natronophilus]MDF0589706.1 16S rRNA (adenine(1518)-N(6)/adenine(1519)-N(6))-dimethyltransferase RsmA [Candidatus Methanocrinis natronophilus]
MKKLGQNFLVDGRVLARIGDYASLNEEDRVLEIGPGTGNLTRILSARAGKVYAIEVDPGLASALEGRHPNVVVMRGDALKAPLPDYNKVVSNLPYQISSKITFRILKRPFDLAVLMYQREFAERMVAFPGTKEYGRLTLNVSFRAEAEILEIVPRGAFRPMPQVESAIVRLLPRKTPIPVDEKAFDDITRVLFSTRRKKVKRSLASMGASLGALSRIDPQILDRRPQELTLEEVALIARTISG